MPRSAVCSWRPGHTVLSRTKARQRENGGAAPVWVAGLRARSAQERRWTRSVQQTVNPIRLLPAFARLRPWLDRVMPTHAGEGHAPCSSAHSETGLSANPLAVAPRARVAPALRGCRGPGQPTPRVAGLFLTFLHPVRCL